MPYIYAVEVLETERDAVTGKEKYNRVFHPVDKETAETHAEGRWALVTKNESLRSHWFSFRPTAEAALKYAKPDQSGEDALGQELRGGDFVMTTIDKYADLSLCEVVSFTGQQVRVRPFNGSYSINGYGTTLKYPSMIVRVDKDFVF